MINLGDKVKDKITGYTGIAVGITTWMQGCRRIGIQSQKLHEGKPRDTIWFDEPQVEVILPKKMKKQDGDNGGPMLSAPTRAKEPTKL